MVLELLDVAGCDLVRLQHLHVHLLSVTLALGLEHVIVAHTHQRLELASWVGSPKCPLLALKFDGAPLI